MSKVLTSLFLSIFFLIASSCETDPYRQGAIMYENFCTNCHGIDGAGLGKNIPPLAGSEYLNDIDKMTCIIRNGLEGKIMVKGVVYNEKMAGIPKLSDFEIANILNFIQHKWGSGKYVQINTVQAALKTCEGRK